MKATVGKVLIVTEGGNIVPLAELRKAERKRKTKAKAPGSKQLPSVANWAMTNGLHARPYKPSKFLELYEHQGTFASCVDQTATDVVAAGWEIVAKDEQTELIESEAKEAREFFGETLAFPNTIRRITKQAVVDWGVFGYCGMEVIPLDSSEQPGDIVNVPASTLWVYDRYADGGHQRKYAQRRGIRIVWFKPFGDDMYVNASTGKTTKRRSKDPANAMLFYWETHPRSEYYGLPRVVSATGDVLGLIYSRDYNLSFFENHGIPAFIVKLKGSWGVGSEKGIEEFIRRACSEPSNAHRTMVLQMPMGVVDGKAEYGDLIVEPVEAIETKEGGFRVYRKDAKQDIMSCYSMPGYRIGVIEAGALGGNVARETTKIYNDSTIRPIQEDFNEMYTLLLRNGFRHTSTRFQWLPLDIRDVLAELKRMELGFGMGAVTPNMVAEAMGYEGYGEEGNQHFVSKKFVPVDLVDTAMAEESAVELEKMAEELHDIREEVSDNLAALAAQQAEE